MNQACKRGYLYSRSHYSLNFSSNYMEFSHSLPIVEGHFTGEGMVTWLERQSRVNREPFKTKKKKKKKKIYKGPAPTVYYCEWNKWRTKILLLFLLLPHWKWFGCYGLFSQKIVINLLRCVLKLMAAWYLLFSVVFSGGKIQHLTI